MESNNSQFCIEMLVYLADVFDEQKPHLTELDAAIGDGDLGVTMTLGFGAIRAIAPTWIDKTPGEILKESAMVFGDRAPSTIGTLFSSGFMGASAAISDKTQLRANDVRAMIEAAGEGIRQRGKADLGEKTLLDALLPAVEAARKGSKLASTRSRSSTMRPRRRRKGPRPHAT